MNWHLFHDWSQWQMIGGTVPTGWARTFQVRKCKVCGFLQAETVEGNYDLVTPLNATLSAEPPK